MNDIAHSPGTTIAGSVAPGFEPVRQAFAANFHEGSPVREHGAALAVYVAGVRVVDLWGGFADAQRLHPWQRDTVCNVYSATKGIVAVTLAQLVDRGLLDYAAPVARYWPEFGCNGKQATTVAQLLSHQAGLAGFRVSMSVEELYDWERCCALLAAQAPLHPPGEGTCYHAMTWGFLAGELARRASGHTTRELVARLAAPLAAQLHIGLAHERSLLAADILPPMAPPPPPPPLSEGAMLALVNPVLDPTVPNTAAWRAAELPAANGFMSADGMARVYAALANDGVLDGVRVLSPAAIAALTQIQSERRDELLGFSGNWALGVSFNREGMLGADNETFGHGGWGGSFGCANLGRRLAIGYVCNRMGPDLVGDPRGRMLCETIHQCLAGTGGTRT